MSLVDRALNHLTSGEVAVAFSPDSKIAVSTRYGSHLRCAALDGVAFAVYEIEDADDIIDLAFINNTTVAALTTKELLIMTTVGRLVVKRHDVPVSHGMLYLGNNRLWLYCLGGLPRMLRACVYDLGSCTIVSTDQEMVTASESHLSTDGVAVYGLCGGDLWTLWLPTGELRVRHFAPLETPAATLAAYAPRAARLAYVLPGGTDVYRGRLRFCYGGSREYCLLNLWLLIAGVRVGVSPTRKGRVGGRNNASRVVNGRVVSDHRHR